MAFLCRGLVALSKTTDPSSFWTWVALESIKTVSVVIDLSHINILSYLLQFTHTQGMCISLQDQLTTYKCSSCHIKLVSLNKVWPLLKEN